MRVVQIQFAPWDKVYNFDPADHDLIVGDKVIVKTEQGTELGKVIGFKDIAQNEFGTSGEIKPVIRKATSADSDKLPSEKQKKKDLEYCKKNIIKYALPMKLVDIYYTYDGSKITFAFIADGRIDFRELVKELTRHFSRTIRLQQIGIRDEAKISGDYGHCGRPLCCGRFLNDLTSITSEMAELQQCVHRGSERISGICGRLMCCLAFEEEGYKKFAQSLPPIDSEVKIEGKKGRVVGQHILKQTVDVLIRGNNGEDGGVVEVEASKIKFT